jgi:hypothetical protein
MLHTLHTGTHIPRIRERVVNFPCGTPVSTSTHILFHVQRELHFGDNTPVLVLLLFELSRTACMMIDDCWDESRIENSE